MYRKKTKPTFEPDIQKIFGLVNQIDEGISFDTVKRIIESCLMEEKDLKYSSPEEHPAVTEAKKVLERKRFEDDLRLIKEFYPEETASSVWEFDEPFISLIMTGLVDALTAYEAYMAHKRRIKKDAVPEILGVRSVTTQKEFFTPEEVDRLTKEDYDDPDIMRKVRNSMLYWK